MLPTWRPDKAMAVEDPEAFKAYLEKLSEVSGVEIRKFADLIDALKVRHAFFEQAGCRLSDHGIEEFYAEDYTSAEIVDIFDKVYGGSRLTEEETARFKTAMLVEFAIMDHDAGWTQQFHYGAIRNNNTRMFMQLGRTQVLTLSETSMSLRRCPVSLTCSHPATSSPRLSYTTSIRMTMNLWLR